MWSLALFACVRPPELPEPITPEPYVSLPDVDAEVHEAMRDGRLPGLAACIVRDGQTVWCTGYGWANLETNLRVTPDTPFSLASVSKTVTAVAVMQAVEDGDLALDDDASEIAGYTVRHPDAPEIRITLEHLLTHSSGIADNWDVLEDHYVPGDSSIPLGDYLEDYLVPSGPLYDARANFTNDLPGEAREYSNMGSALAGQLVGDATGVPLDDHSDARIFGPLGMTSTGWHLADLDPDAVAMPYRWQGGEYVSYGHYGFPDWPDGQLRSSAESMARFLAMFERGGSLDGEQILTEATVARMQQVAWSDGESEQGLIWFAWDLDGERIVGHDGGDDGVSTEMGFRERDGAGFVVLANGETNGDSLERIEVALLEAAAQL